MTAAPVQLDQEDGIGDGFRHHLQHQPQRHSVVLGHLPYKVTCMYFVHQAGPNFMHALGPQAPTERITNAQPNSAGKTCCILFPSLILVNLMVGACGTLLTGTMQQAGQRKWVTKPEQLCGRSSDMTKSFHSTCCVVGGSVLG